MKTMNLKKTMLSGILGLSLVTTGCGSKGASFSLLADQNNFQQNAVATNSKIDVLWVIDNSGSMDSSQQNLATNFSQFIDLFNQKGFDYRMAVTTTDAYKDLFGAPATQSKFRDGTDLTGHTGVFLVDPSTPNLGPTFVKNLLQGTLGSGDERAFQSIKQTLNNPMNAGFPRSDAFLAVIIVSDEDDFSNDTSTYLDHLWNDPRVHTVDSYVSYLDTLRGVTAANRSSKYNVSAITILDQTCLDQLNASYPGRDITIRYAELVDKTNGIKGSLCGNFASTLTNISQKIVELVTQFYLTRIPNPSTFDVRINGVAVPQIQSTNPQPWNGFMYHADTNSITFHGTSVPPQASSITVKFDPTTLR